MGECSAHDETRIEQSADRTILVIDDNERHLDILSTVLGDAGWEVHTSASGLDALAKLAARKYGVILLDLIMPDVDGQALLDRLATLEANARTPVVVCTANTGIARARLLDRSDITAIVAKPLEVRALLTAVSSAIASPEEMRSGS